MSALFPWCQTVDESLINSKIGLVEVMAWHHHGVIPVLESVLTKMSNTIGAIRLQWSQLSWLSFVHVMACRLLGTKPFTHPMLTFCQLYPKECILMICWLKCASFHPWKCIWNAVCKILAILLWCQRVYEGSMNSKLDLSPVMHRAINSSNADFLPIIPSGMYFDKMLVEVHKFLFRKMHSKCRL